MFKRILSVLRALIFGQFINIIIQVVSVPLFLHFWGSQLYGEWLILTALPSYILVSGTGIGFVAGNTMQKNISAGQQKEALEVFQSAWILSIGLSVCILLIVVPIILFAPVFKWINVVHINPANAKTILGILTIYILLSLQTELFSGVYRASGKYARSITILNILRLMEFAGIMLVISLGANAVAASVVYLIIRLAGVIWMTIGLKQLSWPSFGIKYARTSIIKAELIPTFSFLGFPLGHACLIQGMTAVVGVRFGPNAVVVFSIIRTLTNFIKQVASVVYYSIWPEFSTSLSIGKLDVAKTLHRRAFQITLSFSLLSTIVLYFLGPYIIQIWARGKVAVDHNFFLLMLVSTIPSILWNMSSYVSISINKHSIIALTFSVLAAVSMVIAYVLSPYLGLIAIPLSILFSDVFMLFFVLNRSFNILEDRVRVFSYFIVSNIPLKQIMDMPKRSFLLKK